MDAREIRVSPGNWLYSTTTPAVEMNVHVRRKGESARKENKPTRYAL